MEILKLIEYMDSIGHELSLEVEQLRIKRGKHLPEQLKEQIGQNKWQIVEMLERDQAAKEQHFLIGLCGTAYCRSISKQSIVYIEQIKDKWTVWRETYQVGRNKAISHKIICEDESFYFVLQKAEDYFKNIERNQSSN